MPIRGRTPEECFDGFYEHVSTLVADVFNGLYVSMVRSDDRFQRDMQLGPDGTDYVDLSTSKGASVKFHLSQNLRVFERPAAEVAGSGERYQLKTHAYWYKVYDVQPGLTDEPLFRWEYTAEVPEGKHWCRHHFQIGKMATNDAGRRRALEIPLAGSPIDLNRIHIPTGFMLMEYVFRFLFTELEVTPKLPTEAWEAKLAESEKRFFREFSAKTSTP